MRLVGYWRMKMDNPTGKDYLEMEINALKDQISKSKCQSYVWDTYSPAPTKELEKLTRPVNNIIKHQSYFGENKMPLNQQNVMKNDTKCNQCANNADRVLLPPVMKFQPEKCKSCENNPLLVDNFEQKVMPWPPEEGQAIWCISATGVVHEKEYDTERGPIWDSLVMCYVNEGVADSALATLLKARGLDNDSNLQK